MFVCWWCLSFMNKLQYVLCWILLIILCIFVINFLWFSPCLAHGCIPCCSPDLQPRNIAETLNLVCFIEFYLRLCWLVSLALETISGTNTMHYLKTHLMIEFEFQNWKLLLNLMFCLLVLMVCWLVCVCARNCFQGQRNKLTQSQIKLNKRN